MCAVATKYVYNSEAAREIVNDVFMNVWNHHSALIHPVNAYLIRSVRNYCLNYLRDKRQQEVPLSEEHLEDIRKLSRGFHENYLQTARDMAESGLYQEAVQVLDMAVDKKPMVHYYKGFYLEKLGNEKQAVREYVTAETCSPHWCFPNKLEDIAVLRAAMKTNPNGAKACYYLGNLFYDKLQFEEAVRLWEQSEALDGEFPTLLRNLAIAYYNKCHEVQKARTHLEKAFALDTTDARVFMELDQLYKKLGYSFEERLKQYEEYPLLKEERDDLYIEYVTLLNLSGQYQKAYDAIMTHQFRAWEGAEGRITMQYKIALLELAKEVMEQDHQQAEVYLRKSLEYPENLGEGRLEGTRDNHLYYTLGLALERSGENEQARACYKQATEGTVEPAGMMYYYDQPADMILYQGLAKEKLGNSLEANARFYKLIDYGEAHVRDHVRIDYFAVSLPDFLIFEEDLDQKNKAHCYYLMGLGKLGLKRFEEAKQDFAEALHLDPNHQNAAIYRKMAQNAGKSLA